MRSHWLAVLLVFFAAPSLAEAETYRISGIVTYSDGTTVNYNDVEIVCQSQEYDCHPFRGTESNTDMYGRFTLDLDVEEYHDGAELILNVRNENFSHIIDISEMRNSSQNFVTNDMQLLQNRPPPPIFSGFTCGLIILSLAFGMVIVRTATRLMTPMGRAEFVGYRAPRIVDCPECHGRIEQHRLISHLIVEHEIEPLEAGEIAGIVFSKIEMK
ncbi:MAG: hypothetical protein CMB18_02135 [Euryarchaeota archaeon]|nr:hypothetical protein [Euryarchaeota archaeon]|tara:strand:- start:45 stop:686 length:642 start_codon:yes stop_codon:yes gene_type:complete